jgi:hypothetical protein
MYVSSYYYICMCPHTTIYVCARILLYMSVSSYYYICMCPHTARIYVSSYYYICMCPHTALILLLIFTTHILLYIYMQSRLYSPDTVLDRHMRDMESNGLRGPRGTPSPLSQVCQGSVKALLRLCIWNPTAYARNTFSASQV